MTQEVSPSLDFHFYELTPREYESFDISYSLDQLFNFFIEKVIEADDISVRGKKTTTLLL